MKNIAVNDISDKRERRFQPRLEAHTFVHIQVKDAEELETMLGLTQDFSDQGLSVLAYFPLPIGTRVTIKRNDDCITDAEVTAWEWDYDCNMARMDFFIIKKSISWLIN